ncbi:RAMP superfamily CRISPR-associated protein [Defluviitalea phaphyphila]|uniref:RAMP superfamily CRISPR-associated protein n=1 Tax=Defluviitalea phaphyphila TaxID=1473580 RepID=UPI00072FEF43|nr:RAMP superfamily CRISPR-associated protein [Defluviitalea phaphyphila]
MKKPYSFIPFLPMKEYKKTGNEEGKIDIKLEVLTPVHISSGHLQEHNNLLYKQFVKFNNRPIIPGTSLKGCIRSIAEAISYSCYPKSKNVDYKKFSKNKLDESNNCIICNMFGAMGKKSKIRFEDLQLREEDIKNKMIILNIPQFYPPRPENNLYLENNKYKGYKFYHHGDKKILEKGKFPYEFVNIGGIFEGSIRFENMTEEQVNLLCFSLGLNGRIQPKIGYGKPAYYGSVKITTNEQKWIEKANKYENQSSEEVKGNIKKLINILNYDRSKRNISEWENGMY